MEAQVRDQSTCGFASPRAGNRDHVFFSGNTDGPQHPTADFEAWTAEENIAILEAAGQHFDKTGPTPRSLPSEPCEDFPPSPNEDDGLEKPGTPAINIRDGERGTTGQPVSG